MSNSQGLAELVADMIKEDGIETIRNLMNAACDQRLKDLASNNDDYICGTCRQPTRLEFNRFIQSTDRPPNWLESWNAIRPAYKPRWPLTAEFYCPHCMAVTGFLVGQVDSDALGTIFTLLLDASIILGGNDNG